MTDLNDGLPSLIAVVAARQLEQLRLQPLKVVVILTVACRLGLAENISTVQLVLVESYLLNVVLNDVTYEVAADEMVTVVYCLSN